MPNDLKENWWDDLPQEICDFVFNLQLDIPGKGQVSKDVRQDLRISDDFIEEHLRMNASSRYFWGVLYADVRTMIDKMERLAKARRAYVRKNIVEELKKSDIKQTEKLLDTLVESDEEVLKIEDEIANAWNKANKITALISAIEMRHESLRTLAGFKKNERSI